MPRRRPRARPAAFNPNAAQGSQYPGQRPAVDPWLGELMQAGRKFWSSRGVQLPADIPIDVADDLRLSDDPAEREVGGRGFSQQVDGQSRIALQARNVELALELARTRTRTTRERRAALKPLSTLLLHEMGHVGGVPHREDEVGFMGEAAGGEVPQEVARAIRRLVPRQPVKRPRVRRTRSGGGFGEG